MPPPKEIIPGIDINGYNSRIALGLRAFEVLLRNLAYEVIFDMIFKELKFYLMR